MHALRTVVGIILSILFLVLGIVYVAWKPSYRRPPHRGDVVPLTLYALAVTAFCFWGSLSGALGWDGVVISAPIWTGAAAIVFVRARIYRMRVTGDELVEMLGPLGSGLAILVPILAVAATGMLSQYTGLVTEDNTDKITGNIPDGYGAAVLVFLFAGQWLAAVSANNKLRVWEERQRHKTHAHAQATARPHSAARRS